MLITDKNEVLKVLKTVLSGAYYTKFTYYITAFEFELFNGTLDISSCFTLSDIELADKVEWNNWILSFPFNIENCNGPKEPARVFLMGLLTQATIKDVEEENQGTLIITFHNDMRVRLIGEVEIADISWDVDFKNAEGELIGNCTCSFNEMFLTVSEELSAKLMLSKIQ